MTRAQEAIEAPAVASVDHLLGAFQRFQGANERMTTRLVSDHGVGVVELRTLLVLRVYGDLTLTRLGQLLGQASSKITFIADRLEKAGYLSRRPNPGDRRSVLVSLTEAGVVVVSDIGERYRALFSSVINPNDVGRLTRMFHDLSTAMAGEAA